MSRISEIGSKFQGLPRLMDQYDSAIQKVSDQLTITGKTLEVALKEQGTWIIYYAERRAELKAILGFMDDQVSAVRGRLARSYVEQYSRSIGERVMNSYIDAEPEYMTTRQLYLEVEEMYSRYDAAVSCFEKRGYALRDLTNARIHEIQTSQL